MLSDVRPEEYIRSLFEARERVALVAIPRGSRAGEQKVKQRVFSAVTAASPRVQAWLCHLNAKRYDIFVGMQPIRLGAWGRTKGDIAGIKRVYLDIDEDGDVALRRMRADVDRRRLPPPTHVVRSSPGRYQVVWSLPPGSLEAGEAEALMRGLVRRYGADPAAVDVSRVLRLPGFRSWKRDGFPCKRAGGTGREVGAGEFPAELIKAPRPQPQPSRKRSARAPGAAIAGGDTSRSGQDWAWTREQLRCGADPAALEIQLATRRADKSNPGYYARRTVERARASLAWQGAGPTRRREGPTR